MKFSTNSKQCCMCFDFFRLFHFHLSENRVTLSSILMRDFAFLPRPDEDDKDGKLDEAQDDVFTQWAVKPKRIVKTHADHPCIHQYTYRMTYSGGCLLRCWNRVNVDVLFQSHGFGPDSPTWSRCRGPAFLVPHQQSAGFGVWRTCSAQQPLV